MYSKEKELNRLVLEKKHNLKIETPFMIQQQQTNQFPIESDISDLDLEVVYVSKFPVWSTFLTNLLPSIIFFLLPMAYIYYIFTSPFEFILPLLLLTVFIVLPILLLPALFFFALFYRNNFQVPIFQGPYRDYLIYHQRLQAWYLQHIILNKNIFIKISLFTCLFRKFTSPYWITWLIA